MEGSSPRNRCHFQWKSHEPIQCQAKLSGISVSSHSSGYNNFRRTANDNLMKLNSNISEMLTESFKGIDSICSKVRECITDFNVVDALQAKVYNESFADEPSTEQVLRKQQEDRYKYEELKERYRKYRTQRRPDDDTFDFTRKSGENSVKNERRFPFGDAPVARNIKQETPRVDNTVEKDYIDPKVPVKGDKESSKDVKEKYPEICAKNSEEEILALDDLPELTEVLVGEKPDEEVAVEKPKRSKGKSSKKRVRRRSLDEYAQAVKREAQFEDFNSLKAVIQDLTERIDMLSNETLPVKCEEKPENRFENANAMLMKKQLNDAREEGEDEEEDDDEEEEKKSDNDPVVSLMKNISRLLGASLANALDSKTSLPIEFLDSRIESPNPDQEDLLLEDETQKKFLYLEQLLAKRKMDNIKTKNLLNDTSDREIPESSYRNSTIRTRYSNSLYFNEKTMFKTSSKDNLNPNRKSKKINSVLTVMNYSNASIDKLNAPEMKSKPSKYKKLTENRKPKNRNLEYYKYKLDKFGGTNWKQNLYKSGAIDVSTGGKPCSDDFGFEREASLVSFPNTESSKSETSVDFNRKSGKSGPKRAFGNGKTAHSDYEDEIRSDESETSADRVPVFGVSNNENKSKGKGNWIKSKDVQMPFTHWNHLDILDDLTQKDLLPLCSEYPRKDVSVGEKSQELGKDIQETYLWKMVYEQEENDNVWNKLIQPTVEGIKNKSNICEHPQDLSDKTFKKQKSKRRTIEKLAPYMFDPKEESRANQSLIVMPITVQYNNPPQIVKHNVNEEPDVLPSVVGTSRRIKTSRLDQQQALREAVSDREWGKQRKPKKKINGNMSSPRMNDISKEGGKDFDECAEFREKLTPQQTAYKKAIMRNLVKLKELKMKEKREERKMAGKSLMQQQKITAACLPHYTQPTIQSQNYFQRPIIQNPEKERHSARRKTTNAKLRQPVSEFETQSFSDSKSDYERKMLSFKYSKSVGEKLVSFVNKQSPRQDLDIRSSSTIPTNNNDSPGKQPDLDPRDMVMQLKSLKKEDSSVLSSIQKAVDVIENKMIDLLEAPSDLNFDAFDVMESEIKQVLDIMKVDAKNPERLDGELKLEENLQKMSLQLFSKLESLLDSSSEYKEVTSGSEVVEEMHSERPSSMTTLVPETKHQEPHRSPQPKRISQIQSETKTTLTAEPCDMESRKMGEEISNEHIFDKQEDVDADPADFKHYEQHLNTIEQHLNTFERQENDNPEEEEEDAFWDTAEQLQRLNDILQDSEEPEYAPLQRQCATTNLDTVQRLDESLVPDDLTDSIMNLRDEQLKKPEINEDDKEDLGSDLESLDSEDYLTPSHTEFNYVCREEEFLTPPEEAAANLIRKIDICAVPITGEDEEDEDLSTINDASRASDGSSSNFSDQVNDMIKTVEDIYTRLDRIQKNKNLCEETSTDRTRMQLVKQEPTAVVAIETVPASYDNVLNFLEALSDGGETGEVHSARFITRLRYLNNVVDKPSCLRTSDYTKHKKKVSFLVTQQPPTAAALLLPNYHGSGRFARQKSPSARVVVGKLKVTPSLHNILRFLDALIEIGTEEEALICRNTNKVKVVELDGSAETIPEKNLSNKVFPAEDLAVSRVLLSVKFRGDDEPGRLTIETRDKSNGSPSSPKVFIQQRPVIFEKLPPVAGLVTTTGILAQCKSKVVVLKSLYAFVYLLVFTALNMGYKCY